MEAKISISLKNNVFDGQFKTLNNSEMINVKGGTTSVPPLPPTGGDDYPIPMGTSSTSKLPTLK